MRNSEQNEIFQFVWCVGNASSNDVENEERQMRVRLTGSERHKQNGPEPI